MTFKGTKAYTKHKCNTDALCYDDSSQYYFVRLINLYIYRYNLWTGLYILDAPERFIVNLIVGSVLCVLSYGGIAFWIGLLRGIFGAAEELVGMA